METNANKNNDRQEPTGENPSRQAARNPFENNQPVEQDIEQAREELDKEQEFKEAQTERD